MLNPDHQRRLDAFVATLAESARAELDGLINDVTQERLEARYEKRGALQTPEAQDAVRTLVYVRAERDVAATFAHALSARIMNPRQVA